MLCLLTALALHQTESNPFANAPAVSEPQRLAITPKLDGKIEDEEWDALSAAGGVASYFQWEPGRLHTAAKLPAGQELVASFDLKANGWLVGKDNLEVRVRWAGDKPECKVRILDATGVNGPAWTDAPHYQESIVCAAVAENGSWTAELTLQDPGLGTLPAKHGEKIAVRVDGLESADVEAFLPRVLAPLETVLERGSNLPGGLKWKPQFVNRGVAPGSSFRIRMTFNGENELNLSKVEMRTEGLAGQDTAKSEVPFPGFDNKGRAFVDYNTAVSPKAVDGYRVMRTNVVDAQGQTAVIRTSYFIAPIVVLDLASPGKIKASDKEQKIRGSIYVRSNTNKRVDGALRIQLPEGWKLESGDEKGFVIANAFGSVRRVFEMTVPAGVKGAFPIKLQADLGGKNYVHTGWVTVG